MLTEAARVLPLPAPLARGVHAYDEQPSGRTVYYALTSTGALLNNELRRRLPDETEAWIVAEMWRDLDRQDPISPRFGLYVDGVFQPSRLTQGRQSSAGW